MMLELYVWSWLHLHPHHVLKQTAKFIGLSVLILLPLLAMNVALVKRGMSLKSPSFEINMSQSDYPAGDIPQD